MDYCEVLNCFSSKYMETSVCVSHLQELQILCDYQYLANTIGPEALIIKLIYKLREVGVPI